MPVYSNHMKLETIRGIKAFLSLRAGVTRDEVPIFEPVGPNKLQGRDGLAENKALLASQRKKLARKDRRLAQLEKRLEKSEASHRLDSVHYKGVDLPPKNLRPCGSNFQDDEFYLESGKREAGRLAENLGLSTDNCLLDVGSGPGRLAIGILERVGEIRRYCGVDVNEDYARWGWKHITSRHPNFQFLHIDVENTRYNPDGVRTDTDFAFPFGDEEFDTICLYSVFTHMLTDGVRAYLKEFQRILRPDGNIYLTAFLEEGVPEVEENPVGYLGREWKGALHCVRYDRDFFERLLNEAGFRLDRFDASRGGEKGTVLEQGQRGVYLSKV